MIVSSLQYQNTEWNGHSTDFHQKMTQKTAGTFKRKMTTLFTNDLSSFDRQCLQICKERAFDEKMPLLNTDCYDNWWDCFLQLMVSYPCLVTHTDFYYMLKYSLKYTPAWTWRQHFTFSMPAYCMLKYPRDPLVWTSVNISTTNEDRTMLNFFRYTVTNH